MARRLIWCTGLLLILSCVGANAIEIGARLRVSTAVLHVAENSPPFTASIGVYAESQGNRWSGLVELGSPITQWVPVITMEGEYSLGERFGLKAALSLGTALGFTHAFLGLGGQYMIRDDQLSIGVGASGIGISAMRYKGSWTFGITPTPTISVEAGWTSEGDPSICETLYLSLGILAEGVDLESVGLRSRYLVTLGSTASVGFTLP